MDPISLSMQKKTSSKLFDSDSSEGGETVVLDDFKMIELLAEGSQAKIYLV